MYRHPEFARGVSLALYQKYNSLSQVIRNLDPSDGTLIFRVASSKTSHAFLPSFGITTTDYAIGYVCPKQRNGKIPGTKPAARPARQPKRPRATAASSTETPETVATPKRTREVSDELQRPTGVLVKANESESTVTSETVARSILEHKNLSQIAIARRQSPRLRARKPSLSVDE